MKTNHEEEATPHHRTTHKYTLQPPHLLTMPDPTHLLTHSPTLDRNLSIQRTINFVYMTSVPNKIWRLFTAETTIQNIIFLDGFF